MRSPTKPAGSSSRPAGLSPQQAILLGLLHGPAELLPVSSSAHTGILSWLLGWPYSRLDPAERKAFEVALHAGTASAWVIRGRAGELVSAVHGCRRFGLALGVAVAIPAAAGWALEEQIESRLGAPREVAIALLAGSAALVAADSRPRRREARDASPADGVWIGAAQACALVPGVSRGGSVLAAARLRGFSRPAAWQFSRQTATPILLGAAGLKTLRAVQSRPGHRQATAMVAGGVASLLSTLAVERWSERLANRSLLPFAGYRTALGLVILARGRAISRRRSRGRPFRRAQA